MLHAGEMRRSAERSGRDVAEGPGTVIVMGISGAVWRDISTVSRTMAASGIPSGLFELPKAVG